MSDTRKDSPTYKDRYTDTEIRNKYQALRFDIDTSITWDIA